MSALGWYVDTSAFLKLVLEEPGSAAFRRWAEGRDGQLVGSDLTRVEALRAARRHSAAAVAEVRVRLRPFVLLRLSPAVGARASELDPRVLRTLDALHLAAALAVGESLEGLVTYDARLREAAEGYGIAVVAPT